MTAISRENLDLIIMFMDSSEDGGFCAYIDRETGEILPEGQDLEDESDFEPDSLEIESQGRYVQIPSRDSREAWQDMEDFMGTVEDQHLQDLLDVAIRGKGAFRRFKDVLSRSDYEAEQQRWFKFKTDREKSRALEWLASENLQVEEA